MSTPLRRDDTVIGQLRVRGSAAASTQLEQALASANWPTLSDDSWVFIRTLHSKATRHALVPALLAQTRHLLGNAGSTQQIQRFANLNDLLAHLLVDLALGHASQRWYWQHWQALFGLPPSTAMRQLLAEHLLHWPAITAQLQRRQCLATIWHSLTESDARQLLEEQFRMLAVNARAPAMTTATATDLPRLPIALEQRWQPVLRRLPIGDARRRLALAIMAQEFAPVVLRQLGPQWLGQLDQTIASKRHATTADGERPAPRSQPSTTLAVMASPAIEEHAEMPPELASQVTPAVAPDNAGTSRAVSADLKPRRGPPTTDVATEFSPTHQTAAGKFQSVAPQASDAPQPASLHTATTDNHRDQTALTRPPAAGAEPIAARWQPSRSDSMTEVDHFHTRFGGLLFLLNFLNRSEPQQLMATHWHALPNAWCWLFRLGEMLQLDRRDPITAYLANQAGLIDAAALDHTPALPAAAELVALAERWYRPTELWQPSLLQLDAEIRFSASHCDLHARLTQVRLPLRLAGLDINPGWLPWLGRVVTFHYH